MLAHMWGREAAGPGASWLPDTGVDSVPTVCRRSTGFWSQRGRRTLMVEAPRLAAWAVQGGRASDRL